MAAPARLSKALTPAPPRAGAPRPYGGLSEEERRAARRLRLLAAGLEVIGTQGYAAATLRAVCARADLTERYFYESFANREALLVGVHRWVVEQLRADLAAGFERGDASAEGQARAGLAVFFEMLRADPRKARVLLFEMLGVSPDLDRMYQQTAGEFLRFVMAAFRPLMPADRLAQADQAMVFAGLVGAVLHIAIRWHLTRYETPLPTVLESCLVLFRDLSRAPPG
ncbi:MAG TPA: TetR/AcrR family transcriptional regulator [Burkholderiaceae bacterium]|nr:TetR/AcrR family transcriptional regulator [Burkholderiaceae bacterium]